MKSCLSIITACIFLQTGYSQELPCSLQMEQEHKCIKAIYATTPEDPIVAVQDPIFLRCIKGFDKCLFERNAINDCRKEIDGAVESDASFQDIMSSMEVAIDNCFQRNPISTEDYNTNNFVYGGPGGQEQGYGPVENRRRRRRQARQGGLRQLVRGQQEGGPNPAPGPQIPEDSACNLEPTEEEKTCLRDGMRAIQRNTTLHTLRVAFMQKRRQLDQQVHSCRNHVARECRPQAQDFNLMQCLCPATEIFQKEVYDRNEACVGGKVPQYKVQQFSTRCRSPEGPLYPVQQS